MHKPNIAVLILLVLSWILLIVSFASYWYITGSKGDGDDAYIAIKHDGYKRCVDGDCDTGSFDSDYKDASKNAISILQASLAFCVLAWIVVSVTILIIFLSLAGILSKIPIPLGAGAKFLPVVALIFCLLSLFIFLGIGNASYRDCKREIDDTTCNARKDDGQYDFVRYEDNDGVTTYQSPTTGWATIVVSSALVLIGCVINFMMGKYD